MTICSVFVLYEIKMENPPKKKNRQNGNFLSGIGKKHTFGIGNRAEFWPQNRVIESPVNVSPARNSLLNPQATRKKTCFRLHPIFLGSVGWQTFEKLTFFCMGKV